MRMIFSKLRNATMTAQSKLCPFVAVTITDEILYNNICAICDIAGFKPSSIAIRTGATKLLSAYEEGDAEEIKRIGQSSAFNHLDHVVIVFIFSNLYKRPCIPVL